MKGILILAGLSGMLMPSLASAELDYNAVNVGFVTITNNNNAPNYTEFNFGFSKSVSNNAYLDASYETGTRPSKTTSGDERVHSISLGAGYHTPLIDDVDAVVAGHLVQGSAKMAGSSANANGYDIGAGVRAQFPYGLESSVTAVYTSVTSGAYSSKDTFVNAQFGFDFTPEIQMYAGIDLLRTDQTIYFGLRYFY